MTAGIYYIDSGTTDREERIEEDMLREALRFRAPDLIPLPPRPTSLPLRGSVVFGRVPVTMSWNQGYAWPTPRDIFLHYWGDPTFLKYAGRPFELLDWDDACKRVDAMHADGRRVFVKSTDDKLMAEPIPADVSLFNHLDALAFTFIDRPPCLMVQEFVPALFHEYRVMVLEGRPVTGAGRIEHATPLNNEAPFDPKTVRTPSGAVESSQERADRYQAFAEKFAAETDLRNYSLDLCEIGGEIAVVELNPMQPGRLGLFAIDINLFADAVVDLCLPRLGTDPELYASKGPRP